MVSARVIPPPNLSPREVKFHDSLGQPNCQSEWYLSVVGLMRLYDCICRMIVSFLLVSFSSYFFGFRLITNCVSTGFYHLQIAVKWSWSFPVHRIHRKATVRCQSVAAILSYYEYVQGTIVWCFSFLSLSLVHFMQPRWSAPTEGDDVMVVYDPGRVKAILYNLLTRNLRSLVIILHIHPHLLLLISTFATVVV
jgi:hypothetical protein